MKDPYDTLRENCPKHTEVKGHRTCCADENVKVHHPVQPKTQVEKWREEIKENWKAINTCCKLHTVFSRSKNCPKQHSDNCNIRAEKIDELMELLAKDHEEKGRYLNRYPTGTFTDDL